MGLALAEAGLAAAHDDVPVGAVVVDGDGTVIGRGHNRREADQDPLGHAELMALSAAADRTGRWRLDGASLIVTLEPCPMCAGAAIGAVFGAHATTSGLHALAVLTVGTAAVFLAVTVLDPSLRRVDRAVQAEQDAQRASS